MKPHLQEDAILCYYPPYNTGQSFCTVWSGAIWYDVGRARAINGICSYRRGCLHTHCHCSINRLE